MNGAVSASLGTFPSTPEETHSLVHSLGCRERWLRRSAATVTFLAAVAFAASTLPASPDPRYAFLHIRSEQAAPALLGLLLLFNIYAVYQRWLLQRENKGLRAGEHAAEAQELSSLDGNFAETDPLTGLLTRPAAELRLGKEVAAARRHSQPLSVLVMDLDDFGQLNSRYGSAAGDAVLQEFAARLKKATRGADLVARVGADEFLAVLPDCAVGSVQRIVERLSPLVVDCAGQELSVTCSVGWVDHQPGEAPGELLKRAEQTLQLYKGGDAAPALETSDRIAISG